MIRVNLDKAKAITHERRRVVRANEFAPLDAVVMRQVPGESVAEAERARAEIRTKYAAIQERIDAARSVEELTNEVLGLKR